MVIQDIQKNPNNPVCIIKNMSKYQNKQEREEDTNFHNERYISKIQEQEEQQSLRINNQQMLQNLSKYRKTLKNGGDNQVFNKIREIDEFILDDYSGRSSVLSPSRFSKLNPKQREPLQTEVRSIEDIGRISKISQIQQNQSPRVILPNVSNFPQNSNSKETISINSAQKSNRSQFLLNSDEKDKQAKTQSSMQQYLKQQKQRPISIQGFESSRVKNQISGRNILFSNTINHGVLVDSLIQTPQENSKQRNPFLAKLGSITPYLNKANISHTERTNTVARSPNMLTTPSIKPQSKIIRSSNRNQSQLSHNFHNFQDDQLFVLVETADLRSRDFSYGYHYIMINLSRYYDMLMPNKHEFEISSRLSIFELFKLIRPAPILINQVYQHLIVDINKQLLKKEQEFDLVFKYLYHLNGELYIDEKLIEFNPKVLIVAREEKFLSVKGLSKVVKNMRPSIEENLNDPFLKQEMKDLVTNLCQKWVNKNSLKKEFNFQKSKIKFFSKTSRTHLLAGINLDTSRSPTNILAFTQNSFSDKSQESIVQDSVFDYLSTLYLDHLKSKEISTKKWIENEPLYQKYENQTQGASIPKIKTALKGKRQPGILKQVINRKLAQSQLQQQRNRSLNSQERLQQQKSTLKSSNQIQPRSLTNVQMQKICKKFNLTRRQVYELNSLFNSMVFVDQKIRKVNLPNSQNKDESFTNQGQNMPMNETTNNLRIQQQPSSMDSQNDSDKQYQEGVHLTFFQEHCPFIGHILPTVQDRLFQALGIDIAKKNSEITWEQFLELFCIIEIGEFDVEKTIEFWCRVSFENKLVLIYKLLQVFILLFQYSFLIQILLELYQDGLTIQFQKKL
eukprot:403356540